MKKQTYFTIDDDFGLVEIDDRIANDVIKQYIEKKYIGTLILGSFIIGFLLGVIAYAL